MSLDLAPLLASGLLDRDWVGAQLGTVFATDEDAAARCLDPEADCSPHPLYEAGWSGRPVTEYVADALARTTVSPHPLVDLARIVAEHPTAVQHAYGPLAWWITRAREDTPVPVPDGVPEITWGRLRGAALEAAERRAPSWTTSGWPNGVRGNDRRPSPTLRPLPAPGSEPLVSVVLAVQRRRPTAARRRRRGPGPDVRRVGARRGRRRLGRRHRRRAGRRRRVRAARGARGRAAGRSRAGPQRGPRQGARQVRRVRRSGPHLGPRLPARDARPPRGRRRPDAARRDAGGRVGRRLVPGGRRRPRPPARAPPRRPGCAGRPARPGGGGGRLRRGARRGRVAGPPGQAGRAAHRCGWCPGCCSTGPRTPPTTTPGGPRRCSSGTSSTGPPPSTGPATYARSASCCTRRPTSTAPCAG